MLLCRVGEWDVVYELQTRTTTTIYISNDNIGNERKANGIGSVGTHLTHVLKAVKCGSQGNWRKSLSLKH